MPKCDFNKVVLQITLWRGCSPVNLLHIFRKLFPKNTYGGLYLMIRFRGVFRIASNNQNGTFCANR